MAVIFESYFEGGNLDEWDSSLAMGSGNTIEAHVDAKHCGIYGCKCHLDGQAAGDTRLREADAFLDQTETYIRWYFKFVSGFSMTAGDTVELFRCWDDGFSNNTAVVYLYYNGTHYYIWIGQYLDSGGVNLPGYQSSGWQCDSILDDAWHCMEYHFKAGSGSDGVCEWWIDGIERANGSDDYDMDTRRFGAFDLGFRGGDSGTSGDQYIDCVIVDDSTYIGLEVEDVTLVVSDSDHAHSTDTIILLQAHTLAVAEALHNHLTDSPILIQAHILVVMGDIAFSLTPQCNVFRTWNPAVFPSREYSEEEKLLLIGQAFGPKIGTKPPLLLKAKKRR